MLTIVLAIITAISMLGLLCMHPFGKRAFAPRVMAILLSAFVAGLGVTFLSYTYDLYSQGLAMGIGRTAKPFSIASNPSLANKSIVLHSMLSIALVASGLYLPKWLSKIRKRTLTTQSR